MKRAIIACGLVVAFYATVFGYVGASDSSASSTVRVVLANSHGSGVHIGNGFYITAAHVVTDQKTVKLETDQSQDFYTADVLWANMTYDVALLQSRAVGITKSTKLTCRQPVLKEHVSLSGSPLDFKVFQTDGLVAGPIQEIGDWKEAFIFTGASTNGMSGGPLVDQNDRVLGIIVGGHRGAPLQVAVPSSVICRLLGRAR